MESYHTSFCWEIPGDAGYLNVIINSIPINSQKCHDLDYKLCLLNRRVHQSKTRAEYLRSGMIET